MKEVIKALSDMSEILNCHCSSLMSGKKVMNTMVSHSRPVSRSESTRSRYDSIPRVAPTKYRANSAKAGDTVLRIWIPVCTGNPGFLFSQE
jgi:hypothetical protein